MTAADFRPVFAIFWCCGSNQHNKWEEKEKEREQGKNIWAKAAAALLQTGRRHERENICFTAIMSPVTNDDNQRLEIKPQKSKWNTVVTSLPTPYPHACICGRFDTVLAHRAARMTPIPLCWRKYRRSILCGQIIQTALQWGFPVSLLCLTWLRGKHCIEFNCLNHCTYKFQWSLCIVEVFISLQKQNWCLLNVMKSLTELCL